MLFVINTITIGVCHLNYNNNIMIVLNSYVSFLLNWFKIGIYFQDLGNQDLLRDVYLVAHIYRLGKISCVVLILFIKLMCHLLYGTIFKMLTRTNSEKALELYLNSVLFRSQVFITVKFNLNLYIN